MSSNITLLDGRTIPKLGQGTWKMGDTPEKEEEEIATLRRGIELGMTLIDTAEMYGNGRSERLVGKAISTVARTNVFLVSKVLPENSGRERLEQSLDRSLECLGTPYLDMYLLHWRGSVPLKETVEVMEEMKEKGKIRGWGVSNFDTKDMRELLDLKKGKHCLTNQVLYHLGSRGVEFNLLPSMGQEGIPLMAYCPIAQGGSLREGLLSHPSVVILAEKYNIPAMTVLLAYTLQEKWVFSVPKASTLAHMEDNAKAMGVVFDEEDMALLRQSFPRPTRKEPLDML